MRRSMPRDIRRLMPRLDADAIYAARRRQLVTQLCYDAIC